MNLQKLVSYLRFTYLILTTFAHFVSLFILINIFLDNQMELDNHAFIIELAS